MLFAIDSPNFFLEFLQEIDICKNNSVYAFLNPSFDRSLFSLKSGQNNRSDLF